MKRLRFWRNEDGQHRAAGDAVTSSYPSGFRPRHCAGELDNGLCLAHDHPGDAPMGVFPGLDVPVERDARNNRLPDVRDARGRRVV